MKYVNHDGKKVEAPDFTTIQPERVLKVYSGKPGCGCGCRGKYFYNVEVAAQMNEGKVMGPEDNMRSLTRILRTMQKRHNEIRVSIAEDLFIYFIETDTRYYWCYVPRNWITLPKKGKHA